MSSTNPSLAVIGAGLFGSVAGRLAARLGWEVTYFDCRYDQAGSPASGGLMKPGWMPSGLSKADIALGMNTLGSLCEVSTLNAVVHPFTKQLKVTVNAVPPNRICVTEGVRFAQVTWVDPDGTVAWQEQEGDQDQQRYDRVLVATGAWTVDLAPLAPPVTRKVGSSFLYRGVTLERPHIKPWAPYKQLVAYSPEPGLVWAGDGSALNVLSYTPERFNQTQQRVRDFLTELQPTGSVEHKSVRTGWRPMTTDKTGFLGQVGERVWCSTGGGKNGTILAGIHGARFAEVLQRSGL